MPDSDYRRFPVLYTSVQLHCVCTCILATTYYIIWHIMNYPPHIILWILQRLHVMNNVYVGPGSFIDLLSKRRVEASLVELLWTDGAGEEDARDGTWCSSSHDRDDTSHLQGWMTA